MHDSLSPIGLVIFDCDGTLVDSERISNEIVAEILNGHGADISWSESKRLFMGMDVRAMRAPVAAHLGIDLPPDWHDAYYARVIPTLAERVEAIDGAVAAVKAVHEAGIATCVASQGTIDKMTATLTRTGLWDHFEGRVFSAKHVPRPKPFPDLFLTAAKVLGFSPEQCVVVEDSILGIQAGLAANMRVLAFCPEGAPEPARAMGATPFTHMRELPGLLGI